MEDAPKSDGVPEALEAAALEALGEFISEAPGVTAVMRRAVRHARLDLKASQVVIGLRGFVLGLVATGLDELRRTGRRSSAGWFAEVLTGRLGSGPAIEEDASGVVVAFEHGGAVVASPSLTGLAREARRFAEATVGRDRADLRHMLAAFLALDEARIKRSLAAVHPQLEGLDPDDLRLRLYDGIAADPEPAERDRLDVWRRILRIDGPGLPPRPPDEVPRFASDRPVEDRRDPLGVMPDVTAFARLICLHDLTPPLSTGLFGGWGSGKSTFMALLEREIERLTGQQRAEGSEGAPRFIRNAVQVRFNAWHYADANLWASLTAEFFDQLRAGGYRKTGKALHARLVERVNAHVHRLTDEAEATRKAVAASNAQVRVALRARDDAAEKAAAGSEAFRQTLVDSVTEAFEARRADVATLGADPSVASFLDMAAEVRGLWGKLAVVWRYLRAHPGHGMLALAGGVAVAAAAALPLAWDGRPVAAAMSAVGGLTALWGATAPARAAIGRILDSTAAFASELETARTADLAALASAEEALRAAEAEAAARQGAAERAGRALARYVDPSPKVANPPRLLRYMLEDDPDARALEREVGLISRTRRLFQAVDEIVKEERGKVSGRDLEVPERVVIYIDDLDRCTPPQVYSVLQAIHLLLAFELFVVVVGVDVEWVQKALAQEIKVSRIDRVGIATHYLEKIFQLPYWLRPLDTDADGGSYGRLVRALLEADVEREAPPDDATGDAPGTPAPAEADRPAAPSPAVPESGIEGEAPDLAEALVTMTLGQAELEFLASPELGGIAPRDPRAVKRMLNTYRVIRGRLTPDLRADFMGAEGRAPAFPVVAVLLALECDPAGAGMVRLLKRLFADGTTPSAKKSDIFGPVTPRERVEQDEPALAAALDKAAEIRPDLWGDPELWLRWAEIVGRFSFRGHQRA